MKFSHLFIFFTLLSNGVNCQNNSTIIDRIPSSYVDNRISPPPPVIGKIDSVTTGNRIPPPPPLSPFIIDSE